MTKTIAFADDEVNIRNFVRSIARRSVPNTEFKEFANGQELVTYFETVVYTTPNQVPVLVVTDYNMPVMDGLEAVRRIRALEVSSGVESPVPVYLHTAKPQEVEPHKENLKLSGVIEKPSDMQTIRDLLTKYAG